MDIATVLCIVGLLLRISVAVPAHSWDESDLSTASVVVKEGESAEISCMLKESNVAYFWLKGGSLENSTVVASFISDITVNDPDDPFTVTENGTLIIKKVSRNDEGNYICRVSSEEISCHGDVFVFVQAVLQDFQLTIEYCEPENSCVISTESTKPTSLTCKATNASPSMKLKWFNGSREIKDNIEENSLTKGTTKEISSTIKDVYKAPSTLTCQAVDFKTSNDDGMFAHVQFRTSAATADISTGWIVTAILFIVGFVILLLIVIFIKVWPMLQNGKDIETPNSPERESLLTELQTKVDEKSEEITKLKKSLEAVTEQLLHTNEEHQKTATTQHRNLESKLQTQTDSLTEKKIEIQKLKSKLENVEEQLTKIQKREQEISSKERRLTERETNIKRREDDMNSNEPKLRERETKIKGSENNLNLKESKLRKQEIDIKRREDDMNSRVPKLREREKIVKTREDDMNAKELRLKAQENIIKKREDEVHPKETRLAAREALIKKQLLDLETKARKVRLDRMDSKDPICINCRLIPSMSGDDVHVATEEKGGQAKVKAKSKWSFAPKDAKFHTIYPTSAKPIHLCQSIDNFLQNAIDGGKSCLIAHDISGQENWTTMFGPEGASDALMPYAITTIFKRANELTTLGYKIDVQARFADTSNPSTISKSVKNFEIANEQAVFKLLKEGQGKIDQTDGTMDHFVQLNIKTETDQETLSGVLVLGTFGSIQMIKECLLSVKPTTQSTQNISAIISDGRCRSVLITHIHEDKLDETKDCLAMVKEISKKNKK